MFRSVLGFPDSTILHWRWIRIDKNQKRERKCNLLLHEDLPRVVHLLLQRDDQERHLVGELEGDEVPLDQVAEDVQKFENRLRHRTIVESSVEGVVKISLKASIIPSFDPFSKFEENTRVPKSNEIEMENPITNQSSN